MISVECEIRKCSNHTKQRSFLHNMLYTILSIIRAQSVLPRKGEKSIAKISEKFLDTYFTKQKKKSFLHIMFYIITICIDAQSGMPLGRERKKNYPIPKISENYDTYFTKQIFLFHCINDLVVLIIDQSRYKIDHNNYSKNCYMYVHSIIQPNTLIKQKCYW